MESRGFSRHGRASRLLIFAFPEKRWLAHNAGVMTLDEEKERGGRGWGKGPGRIGEKSCAVARA